MRCAHSWRKSPVTSTLGLALRDCSLSVEVRDPGDADDPLASYRITASNEQFDGATDVWGYPEQFQELAASLEGFPASASSTVTFTLGSSGMGEITLEFMCVDGSGHAAVWVTLTSARSVAPTAKHQRATICLRFEAASMDSFCRELHALSDGRVTIARLHANEP